MGKIQRFEDLDIWQKAIEIAVEVYQLADKGLLATDFKSRGQFIDAAISISNNIAEGFEYNSNRSFINFLRYAKGSAGEVRSQLAILVAAGRVNNEDYEKLKSDLFSLSSKIKAFINYLKAFNQKK